MLVGLGKSTVEQRPHHPEHRVESQIPRLTELLGDPCVGLDLRVDGVDVAKRKQRVEPMVVAPREQLDPSGHVGQADNLGRDRQPLFGMLDVPDRFQPGVQHDRQNHRVAELACQCDRLLAQ